MREKKCFEDTAMARYTSIVKAIQTLSPKAWGVQNVLSVLRGKSWVKLKLGTIVQSIIDAFLTTHRINLVSYDNCKIKPSYPCECEKAVENRAFPVR